MTTPPPLPVSELDFLALKQSFMNFLQSQEEFRDFNYTGSGINTLLEILAYNTHINGFYANMVANEMFLDSAERRTSVVSHAKHLGYTPNSIRASSIIVDVYHRENSIESLEYGDIIEGTNKENEKYNFVVLDTYTPEPSTRTDSEGNPLFVIKGVKAYEGKIEFRTYIYDNENEDSFELPENTDTNTLIVRVLDSVSSQAGSGVVWKQAKSYLNLTKESNVYFLQEGKNGKFEIFFGDGIIGKKLKSGNVVVVQCITTNGPSANMIGREDNENISSFNTSGAIFVHTIQPSSGGSFPESTQSIRRLSPLMFQAQGRSVTETDYASTIVNQFPYIDSIRVWGGQYNNPPEYGKVFICIKPKIGIFLTRSEKNQIETFLRENQSIVSVTPEIVDPDPLFVAIHARTTYNPSKTTLTQSDLRKLVREQIRIYINNELEKFDADLYTSSLTNTISKASQSFIGTDISLKMKKHIFPRIESQTNYIIDFANPIYTPSEGYRSVITSSPFNYRNRRDEIESCRLEDDGLGKMRIVNSSTGSVVISDVGKINYEEGIIYLHDFSPVIPLQSIRIVITAKPKNQTILSKRQHIITLDNLDSSSVTAEVINVEDQKRILGKIKGGQ